MTQMNSMGMNRHIVTTSDHDKLRQHVTITNICHNMVVMTEMNSGFKTPLWVMIRCGEVFIFYRSATTFIFKGVSGQPKLHTS